MEMNMIIQNANVYNSFTQSFSKKDVAIKDGQFVYIADRIRNNNTLCIDVKGRYMIPALVDIHMHIESSMSIPTRFSDAVLPLGTTTVVADPHEIANVFGLEGIQAYMSSASALDIFYGIPSSVPSTNEKLETTGGKIGIEEIEELLRDPRIICLGEVMNFHDVCYEPNSLSANIIKTCKKIRSDLPIEGHCPKVSGEELAMFIANGVTADHTQQTSQSVIEKIESGMFLEIQRKSMTPDVMKTLINNQYYEYFAFVTDDVMADKLTKGHLNELVIKAVEMGMPFEKALYCATFTPARRMHLEDRGAIAPGRIADFIILNDTTTFSIDAVYKNGKIVEKESQTISFPEHFYHSIKCNKAIQSNFMIPLQGKKAKVNVMAIEEHSTFTKHEQVEMNIDNGFLNFDGYCLLTVFERYGKNGNIAHAIVKNALKKQGAIATSWAHDHHNVIVLGNNTKDMMIAQHTLIDMQGGYVVVSEGKVIATVQLEIGGIVSERPIEILGEELKQVRNAMEELGYRHDNVIMSCSTLSLPVSPELKISDVGMINTRKQCIVPLVEEIYDN